MKEYFRYFRVLLGILVVTAIIYVGSVVKQGNNEIPVRKNTACDTKERVFDYADKLTTEEESSLRELIARREKETGCDIVIVTLNESLEEYAKKYESKIGTVTSDKYVMVYADNFYDEHKFGFNGPIGDGTILLDNWYRESDGKVHSWMGNAGKAKDKYSSAMIDNIINESLKDVTEDPYEAYKQFIDIFYEDMTGKVAISKGILLIVLMAISFIISLIYVLCNSRSRKGEKTVNSLTYVNNGNAQLKRKSDLFLRKVVTQRKIERDNNSGSSGGGGSHTSSSGASHGGGGHSR